MVITTKISDRKFRIMIPDEGVKDRLKTLESQKECDIIEIFHFEIMDNYYNALISHIDNFIGSNEKKYYYKLLEINDTVEDVNFIHEYIVQCNSYDITKLSKKISSIIRNAKDEYTHEYFKNGGVL